jgi:hypothetical protein
VNSQSTNFYNLYKILHISTYISPEVEFYSHSVPNHAKLATRINTYINFTHLKDREQTQKETAENR